MRIRSRCVITAMCLALVPIITYGHALAHGTEEHGNMKLADAQMKKLHAMMPMFSTVSAQLESALEKGDAAAAEADAGKVLVAIPDLKKSIPHKNIKQQKQFVELAKKLKETVTSTANLAKNGDFVGARVAFKKVEEACAGCHARFRD